MKTIYFIPLLVIFLDQLSKFLLSGKRFWLINYTENTGVAFGLLQGWNLVFIFGAIAIIVLLAYWISTARSHIVKIALLLVLGGATSNLIDRLIFGFVRDFIDLGFWPIFNVADMVNVAGIVVLAYYLWRE